MSLESAKDLHNVTAVITGASRGIGRAIALRLAKEGANVAIVAKTTTPHPKLPGTIYTVAKEVEELGGKALPVVCDIRDDQQVEQAVDQIVKHFGTIDILVNNASAIVLQPAASLNMKSYDLMHDINVRGTYAMCRASIPHLQKSPNAHILNLSPPMDLDPKWFANHTAYTMSKFGMSMVAKGLAAEFRDKIAVNALWPRTIISTAALQAFAGDQLSALHKQSRTPEIVADAAYSIFKQPVSFSGNFLIDEHVLKAQGVVDFKKYSVLPSNTSFATDLFLTDESLQDMSLPQMQRVLFSPAQSKY